MELDHIQPWEESISISVESHQINFKFKAISGNIFKKVPEELHKQTLKFVWKYNSLRQS